MSIAFRQEPDRVVEEQERRARRPSAETTTLVTGGAGFVGSHVARTLCETGRSVVVLDARPFAPEGRFILGPYLESITFIQGSVDDLSFLLDVVRRHSPHEIVHLAAIISSAQLAANRLAGFRVNIGGAVNLLELARAFAVERVVNFSSMGVIPRVVYEPTDPAHPIILPDAGPQNFYAAAKAAVEALSFAYHQVLGVDVRIIRPSAVYGLGMTQAVGPIKAMVEGAVRGERVHVTHGGKHPRDYTHAMDIGSLVVKMLEAPDDADRVFYGATGEPLVTATDVARIVREIVAGADIEIGEELSDSERWVFKLRSRLSIDNARAQLGWEPRYRNVRDGIEQYAHQYRAFLDRG